MALQLKQFSKNPSESKASSITSGCRDFKENSTIQKSTENVANSCETNKENVLQKGLARSGSGIGSPVSPQDPNQDRCSAENDSGLPEETCLDCVDKHDEHSCQG